MSGLEFYQMEGYQTGGGGFNTPSVGGLYTHPPSFHTTTHRDSEKENKKQNKKDKQQQQQQQQQQQEEQQQQQPSNDEGKSYFVRGFTAAHNTDDLNNNYSNNSLVHLAGLGNPLGLSILFCMCLCVCVFVFVVFVF